MPKPKAPPPAAAVRVLTLNEVAELLRIHQTTVYRLLRQGKIPAFRIGSDWRFNQETIEKWMRAKEGQQHR